MSAFASDKRKAAFRLGVSAENRAAILLAAKGYRTIARRWKSPVGEIDLVVRRGRLIAFVEVKARKALAEAAESVLLRQRRRIVAAAEAWLAAHPEHAGYDIRFDAVLVSPGRLPQHIVAAFEAD
jgi:putative endonuclease